jgi:amidase
VAEPAVREALAPALGTLEGRFGVAERVAAGGLVRGDGADLTGWKDRFRTLQGHEIWLTHGDWIEQRKPRLGPEIAARFAFARSISAEAVGEARPMRELFAAAIERLTADAVLAIPTAPVIAPRLDDTAEAFLAYRDRTLTLTCIAGLARVPQVSIPAGEVEGAPIALSLIARRGADLRLLALAAELASGPA